MAVPLAVLAAGAVSAPAAPAWQPGEWKYHMVTHIDMMGLSIPSIPVTFTSCMKGKKPVAESPEMKKAGCKVVDYKRKGNTYTYTGHCAQGDSVIDTHYRMTYHGDNMEGTFDQVRSKAGEVQSTANGTMDGKRLASKCAEK